MPEPNPRNQQSLSRRSRIVDDDTLLATIQSMPTEAYHSSIVEEPLTHRNKESAIDSTDLIGLDPVKTTSTGDISYNASLISSDSSGGIPKGSVMGKKSRTEKPHSASLHCAHDQLDSPATYLAKEVADGQSDEQVATKVSRLQTDVAEMRSMMAMFDTRLSLIEARHSKDRAN